MLTRDLTTNALLSRLDWVNQLLDPRRSIEDECGYPASVNDFGPDNFKDLYDRDPIAARVVEVMPKECWQSTPSVYETEDADNVTAFEQAWNSLEVPSGGGISYHRTEQGGSVWDYLIRADILSGIGHFGVILIGIDDGKNLADPIDGVVAVPESYSSVGSAGIPSSGVYGYNPEVTGTEGQYDRQFPRATLSGYLGAQQSGTDQQYFGVQFGPSEAMAPKAKPKPSNLLFLRCFDESLVQIARYEWNVNNPRFGLPVMYRITLNDPRERNSGIGLPLATVYVHWSRLIHIADELRSSAIFGIPRMRPVLHRLLDLRKLYGGSAEMFWRGAFPGLSLETNPSLGGDASLNINLLRDMVEQYQNGLQRYLALAGMTAKTLAPQVSNPSNHIQKQLEAICINLGIPMRILMGTERGSLASSQDTNTWNSRVSHRQDTYLTPCVIVPFVDRLIACGVLPIPPEGFTVRWPDAGAMSDAEKADIAAKQTAAIAQYATAKAQDVVGPSEFLTKIMGFDEEEAGQMADAAQQWADEQQPPPAPVLALHPPGQAAPGTQLPSPAATIAQGNGPAKESVPPTTPRAVANQAQSIGYVVSQASAWVDNFNPYHDDKGRFSSAEGESAGNKDRRGKGGAAVASKTNPESTVKQGATPDNAPGYPALAPGAIPAAPGPAAALQTDAVKSMKPIKGKQAGANSSFLVTFADKSQGIFKPASGEDPNLRQNVPGGTYYLREAATYAIAKIAGFGDLVPATAVRTINGQIGSVMRFVSGATEAIAHATPYDGEANAKRAAVLDYLIGNTDRHMGNWMLAGGRMVLIDHGLAFPTKQSTFSNTFLTKNAAAQKWTVPADTVKSLETKWPEMEKALREGGIDKAAIDLTKTRLDHLMANVNQPFANLSEKHL